jgi:hypothetical protein
LVIADEYLNSGELSVAEASLDYGVSEGLIRQAVRSGVLASIQHRWGLRIRREDITRFVTERGGKLTPATELYAQSQPPIPAAPRSRPPSKSEREEIILRLVEERGEVSVSAVHQLLLNGGMEIPYSTVAATVRRLLAEGRLTAQKQGRSYTYRLPRRGGDVVAQTLAPPAPPTPRPQQQRSAYPSLPIRKIEAVDDQMMRETLAAMRSLGRAATLDEIYRALASRAAFVDLVRAVRWLVSQRLAVRIKQEHGYLYRVAE